MYGTGDIRKVSMIMVVAIAMVAVLLPMCAMLQCQMTPLEMLHSHMGLGFSSRCATTMDSAAQAAVAPGSLQTIILMLFAVMGFVYALALPSRSVRFVRVSAEEPPPPPEDPLGTRLTI